MNTLHSQILDALKDRSSWEEKQRTWYKLRHSGPGRNKPYPGASNLHFPLIDSVIEKLKPFFFQQIYATETLAAFICKISQGDALTSAAANWFDYKVKQESNFEREILCNIDKTQQDGGAPFKAFWCHKKKRLEYDAVDPLHLIVPNWTEELPDADWVVHVTHLSVAQYRANSNYKQDAGGDDFVKSITGKGTGASSSGDNALAQDVELREGITCGKDKQIVLWEIYTRDPANWDKIIVKTRSPIRFEEPIRQDFELPFKHGTFPFVRVRAEIKDKGYYSPRGQAEVLAPFEAKLCKDWNSENDWLDFFGRPMFRQDGGKPLVGTHNFKSQPGAILPQGLIPAEMPRPPLSWKDQMNTTRTLAEYRVQMPDFGVENRLGGKPGNTTATEVNAVVGQSSQSSDLRGRVFRLDLGDIYRMSWSLLCQYAAEDLFYIYKGASQQLPPGALHENYEIAPNGSADSWNKNAQMQKAIARFQLLRGDPFINQGELRKDLLNADDNRLVDRLYLEPQDEQAGEMEEQAMEIGIMMLGFPASVDPQDDDKAHIQCVMGFVQRRVQSGEPIMPELARHLLEHCGQHHDGLVQKKDPAAKAIERMALPTINLLGQIAAQVDPREANNVVAMPVQPGVPAVASPLPPAGNTASVAPAQPQLTAGAIQ